MKVSFENGVSTYSGKYKEVVYQNWFNGQICYARQYAYPTLGSVHDEMKAISLNLNSLYLEADVNYIADLKAYAAKNSVQNRSRIKRFAHKMPSSKSLFIKCMWAWYDTDPTHIDLKTITISDMVTLESPVIKVVSCVDAGYLKRVTGFKDYDNPIVVTP